MNKADHGAYLTSVWTGETRDIPTLYALYVRAKKIVAGPYVRMTCERHLRDLLRAEVRTGPAPYDPPVREELVWDPAKANEVVDFFTDALVLEDGSPFNLELWQGFIVGCLFGWKGMDGWRRFRNAYIEIGKGNGKSPLVGGIGLVLLAADNEPSAEVYAAATKMDQAKILWNDAKRMAEGSPVLSGDIDVRANVLAVLSSGSVFKPISSEKRGLDGPRVHGGLIDELHEHADGTVVRKLRAGTKARNQALIIEITNSGFDKKSICYQHHEYSIRVLRGQVTKVEDADTWFSYICALDEGDDPFESEDSWIKANPNLGVSIKVKYLREQVAEAKGMPANRSTVARLNFCQWVGAENPWIDPDRYAKILVKESEIAWETLRNYPCYLGFDLSARRDLTAMAVVWKIPEGLVAKIFYFTPKEDIERRSKEDRNPYNLWADLEHLTATPGPIVDYAFVAYAAWELSEEFNVVAGAFDPWRIDLFRKELEELNFDLLLYPHGQAFGRQQGGAKDKNDERIPAMWMPESIEKLEQSILQERLWLVQSPVTDMCVQNAVTISDPAGNKKFAKEKASGKIDGVVALAMAVGLALRDEVSSESKYEDEDMLVL